MKTVIITGGAAGIGRETALLFASKGNRVVIADLDITGAETTAHDITTTGGHAHPYRLDVSDEQQWENFGKWIHDEFGAADVLINNAGIMDLGGFVEMSAQQWQRTVDIDLMSVIYGSRVFAQQMIDTGLHGHIVNLSSGAAYAPFAMEPAYGAAKAAVLMATQALRVELRQHGIGVTAICPGAIRTDLLAHGERAGLTDDEQAAWRDDIGKAQSLAFAGPDKVARIIERSVRHNWAIVPVNPESWFAYALFRVSPSLMRAALSLASFDRAEALLTRVRPLLARLAK